MLTMDEKMDTANPAAARARRLRAAARMHDKIAARYAKRAGVFFGAPVLMMIPVGALGGVTTSVGILLLAACITLFVFMCRNFFSALWHGNESYVTIHKSIRANSDAIHTALDDLALERDFQRAQNNSIGY